MSKPSEKALVEAGFFIVEEVGAGGMANVFKVRDGEGRVLAAKVLRLPNDKPGSRPEERMSRFEREFASLKRIDHPGVVKAVDFIHAPGSPPIIVMDFVNGTVLKSKVGAPLPWRRAVAITIDILDALGAVHGQGLIHRDITLGNIMLVDDGRRGSRAKIIDFGIAFDGTAPLITETGQVIGTTHFIAPERLSSDGQYDHRADLYSVGVLLYWLLAGRAPYHRMNRQLVHAAHQRAPVPQLPTEVAVPDTLRQQLQVAMSKDQQDRFPNAGTMWRALAATLHRPEATESGGKRRTRKFSLSLDTNAPGVRIGAMTMNSGRHYQAALKRVVEAAEKHPWPNWATSEQTARCLASLKLGRLALRANKNDVANIELACSACGAVRNIEVVSLGHLVHCEYCGADLGTAPFRPLDGPTPVPVEGGLFASGDGSPRLETAALEMHLVSSDGGRIALPDGPSGALIVAEDQLDGAGLEITNRGKAPIFRPVVQVSVDVVVCPQTAGEEPWLRTDAALVAPLRLDTDQPLPVTLDVCLGAPRSNTSVARVRLFARPVARQVDIAIGERAVDADEPMSVSGGEQAAAVITFARPLPNVPVTAAIDVGGAGGALQVVSAVGDTLRLAGLLPLPNAAQGLLKGRLRVHFSADPYVESAFEVDVKPPQAALARTKIIKAAALDLSGVLPDTSVSDIVTTGVTRRALAVSGLRVSAFTTLTDEGQDWVVPTVVPGIRHVHPVELRNGGSAAVVIKRIAVVDPADGRTIDWISAHSKRDEWPLVIGRDRRRDIELWIEPPAQHPAVDQPTVLQLMLHMEGAPKPDDTLLVIEQIHRRVAHAEPLVIDIGTTAVRCYTLSAGEFRPLSCDLSGSLLEPGHGIPAACRLVAASSGDDRPAFEGIVGADVVRDVLENGGHAHLDARAKFDSAGSGVGGALDTRPIQVDVDGRMQSMLAQGIDLLSVLLSEAVAAICRRYRLIVTRAALLHPVGYSHLHIARLFDLARRLLPDADIYLGLGDARADAAGVVPADAGAIIVDVGSTRTRVSILSEAGGRHCPTRVTHIPVGGEHVGDALLTAAYSAEPPSTKAATPSAPPWRTAMHADVLFTEPGPIDDTPRIHGPLPPWLARLGSTGGGGRRQLRLGQARIESVRDTLARRVLRAAAQRAAAGDEAQAFKAEFCKTFGQWADALQWIDEGGERCQPNAVECAHLAGALFGRAPLDAGPVDTLVGQVVELLADVEPEHAVVLAGRGHLGSRLADRLARETGRVIHRGSGLDRAKGAHLWVQKPGGFTQDHVDRLRCALKAADDTVIIPSGVFMRGAVGYCAVTGRNVRLSFVPSTDDPISTVEVTVDTRRIAQQSKISPDAESQGFPYPRVALKVWLRSYFATGRDELWAQPVALGALATPTKIKKHLAALREKAEPMPVAVHAIKGNGPLADWLAEDTAPPALKGERPLADATSWGTCPVLMELTTPEAD